MVKDGGRSKCPSQDTAAGSVMGAMFLGGGAR